MSENHYCRTVKLKADPMKSAMDAASENGKVKCIECGALVDRDSEDYVQIMGNILIGERGGIVGNNFGEDGMLKRSTCICRKQECLAKLFRQLEPETSGRAPSRSSSLAGVVRSVVQDIRTGRI